MSEIKTLLFDLGGVLVELTGVDSMMSWSDLDEEEVWHRWTHSTSVRLFESGACSASDFAERIVEEFSLTVSPCKFLQAFEDWPVPYPGVSDLLQQISRHFHMVCLSNTNHLHWQRFEDESDLLSYFDMTLPSHITGMMKPDIEVYHHVLDVLEQHPASILFLDDNQLNIDAAREVGLQSDLTRSLSGVVKNLKARGLFTAI